MLQALSMIVLVAATFAAFIGALIMMDAGSAFATATMAGNVAGVDSALSTGAYGLVLLVVGLLFGLPAGAVIKGA